MESEERASASLHIIPRLSGVEEVESEEEDREDEVWHNGIMAFLITYDYDITQYINIKIIHEYIYA